MIKFKKLHPNAKIPTRQTPGSAGYDLHYCGDRPVELARNWSLTLRTGLAIELPCNYEAQIRPRSGLACRYAVTVVNSPGTIDSDYRGEILVCLINHNLAMSHAIRPGDRIAQLVFNRVEHPPIEVVDELSTTERGSGGFGSTGVV